VGRCGIIPGTASAAETPLPCTRVLIFMGGEQSGRRRPTRHAAPGCVLARRVCLRRTSHWYRRRRACRRRDVRVAPMTPHRSSVASDAGTATRWGCVRRHPPGGHGSGAVGNRPPPLPAAARRDDDVHRRPWMPARHCPSRLQTTGGKGLRDVSGAAINVPWRRKRCQYETAHVSDPLVGGDKSFVLRTPASATLAANLKQQRWYLVGDDLEDT